MTSEEFTLAAKRLLPFADYLYFHLMGEPLLHPLLGKFLDIAGELGHKVIITTNGTLLSEAADTLCSAKALHKVSISLHCREANSVFPDGDGYLDTCFDFCEKAAKAGKIAVMRLWNIGGMSSENADILERMRARFKGEWKEIYSGYKLSERIFLEWGEKFDWPDTEAPEDGVRHSCYGLSDQIGVLCDGSVVPCCLDAEGAVLLGNIYDSELSDILSCKRAKALSRSFERYEPCEELCKRCGYAARFTKKT